VGLLKAPRRVRLLMSEVTLYAGALHSVWLLVRRSMVAGLIAGWHGAPALWAPGWV